MSSECESEYNEEEGRVMNAAARGKKRKTMRKTREQRNGGKSSF